MHHARTPPGKPALAGHLAPVCGMVAASWLGCVLAMSPGTVAAQAGAPAAGSVHDLAVYFTTNGWFECARRANQVATFLGGRAAGQIFVVNQPSASSDLVGVTLLVPTGENHAVADMVFSLRSQECPASYTIVEILETSCPEQSENEGSERFMEIGETGHHIARLSQGAMVRLSPLSSGCMRVQTEIVTEAN